MDSKENLKVIENGFLGVNEDIIDYIGEKEPSEHYDTVKDMKGTVLMPGLVNAHGHGPMNMVRGVGTGLPLQEWLDIIFKYEAVMTPEDIYAGQLWACYEMIKTGTTTVIEMYDFPWTAGRAIKSSGMKGHICRVGLSFSEEPEIPPNRFDECADLVKNWNDPTGRVRADFCIHAEYTNKMSFVKKIAKLNREAGANVNIHLSETERENRECMERHGITPTEFFLRAGILDGRVYAAHCVHLTENDKKILKEKNVTVVNNPSSNAMLGSGIAEIRDLLDRGINVALGTDGSDSNNNLDMFEEMHVCALMQKAVNKNPTAITAEEVIKMATINGARACGRFDTGAIQTGKKADIIAVSLNEPHMFPTGNIIDLLVYSAQGSDVVMTMVDGKILYEDGECKTIDINEAKTLLGEAVDHLFKDVKLD